MGLYVIRNEGAHEEDGPEDVGVIIEGVELLSNLRSISLGWAMLFWVDLHSQLELSTGTQVHFRVFTESVDELGWQQAVTKGPKPENQDASVSP